MKKLLTLVIIVLIAIGLIGPKFAGNTFNEQMDAYIASLNTNEFYKVTVLEREQTWFSSTANIQVVMVLPEQVNAQSEPLFDFVLQANAQHGPLLTRSGLGLGWLDWDVRLVSDELPDTLTVNGDGPIYQASGVMGLFGSSSYNDRLLALEYTDASIGMVVSTQGWQGEGDISTNALRYSGGPGQLFIKALDMYDLSLEGVTMSYTADASINEMLKGNFYDGGGSFFIDKMRLNSPDESSQTLIEKLQIQSTADFNPSTDLADIEVNMSMVKLDTPEVKVDDLTISMTINNIQQAFSKAYQKMNQDIMESPAQAQEIMQQAMQTHLLGQLIAEPEINITELVGVINGGNIDISSSNKLVGVTSLPDTMENNAFWMQHLDSNTRMSVDESAALTIAGIMLEGQLANNPQLAQMPPEQFQEVLRQQSAATLNSLVQQGFFIKTEAGYSMLFTLKDGKAVLNSNNIPLPM
ncbi:YdgA family protein [Glaciecola siphonariae]|uniref:YdgA family protein n=1 Tax=Glaciecola siphonariae TaxID=521012 RepID=A0ABV9LYM0_9ALTE